MKRGKNSIEFYYQNNRFWKLFWKSKKYRDLLFSKEAFFCLCLSIITTYLLMLIMTEHTSMELDYPTVLSSELDLKELTDTIRSLLLTIGGGFFSLLGFSVGGLAILTGTISSDVISKIVNKEKIDDLMSVIFNFYMAGAITGFSIILCVITYVFTFTAIEFKIWLFLIWSLVLSYFVYFSIVYSIMLLGTCIRLFLLKHFYTVLDKD